MKLWAGAGEWGLDRRTGGVETTVAKTVEMVICAEYQNGGSLDYELNVYFSPNYIVKYISHTQTHTQAG